MNNNFELTHVGINTASPEEALNLAKELSEMFNWNPRHGNKSEFAGNYFECMKSPYLGENGHIAITTDNLQEAVKELEGKGYSFKDETSQYDENGNLKNIYLDKEFGGFAIHIMQKKK